MKRFTGIIASLLVLVTVPVFAASKKPQTIVIPQNVQVGAAKLPAGSYKLAWTGTGQEVQVTLTQTGKTALTFAAKATQSRNEPGVMIDSSKGTATLKTIFLNNVSLQVEAPAQPGL